MSERVTCANCGFLNEPGDEFCGDCGTYLAWSGAPAATPTRRRRPVRRHRMQPGRRPRRPPVPPTSTAGRRAVPTSARHRPAQPAAAARSSRRHQPPPPTSPQGYQVMPPPAMGGQPCRNCGLVNPPGRSFCQRCGQRLDPAVGTMAGSPRPAPGHGGRDWCRRVRRRRQATRHRGHRARLHRRRRGRGAVPERSPELATRPSARRPSRPRRRGTPAATDERHPSPTEEPSVHPRSPTGRANRRTTTVAPRAHRSSRHRPRRRRPGPPRPPTPSPPTPSQAPPPTTYVCDTDSHHPGSAERGLEHPAHRLAQHGQVRPAHRHPGPEGRRRQRHPGHRPRHATGRCARDAQGVGAPGGRPWPSPSACSRTSD